ncbi:HAD-IIA family hydrolase [Kitasatospora sp. LaBMicrA B282]|uniref:HAD-IIA family hydrolase n=1 Tax=Kitasatospora sp. LaBMicrA B282 TaxID=3420949 RepID=UPI003D0DB8A3
MTDTQLPGHSEQPLVAAYDTALLDLDGVVYAGPAAIDHAVASLDTARSAGMRLAYVTNNASRPPRVVAEHLTELGVPAEPADVINSAQAAARLLADKLPAGAKVLVVGGPGLVEALAERGLVAVESLADEPAAVVQGFDPSVGWERLAEAAYAVARGLPWVASNTDMSIPTARGVAPGNGTLVAAVQAATGAEPEVAGKPLPPMHRETVLRTGAKRPLVVGDRLDTDIEGAHNGGVDSLLVFTGVATPAQLLGAPVRHRPTYLAADLRGLLEPHPAVTVRAAGGFDCRGRWAAVQDGELRVGVDASVVVEGAAGQVAGADGRYDGLRALCAAAWAELDRTGEPVDGRKALAELGF